MDSYVSQHVLYPLVSRHPGAPCTNAVPHYDCSTAVPIYTTLPYKAERHHGGIEQVHLSRVCKVKRVSLRSRDSRRIRSGLPQLQPLRAERVWKYRPCTQATMHLGCRMVDAALTKDDRVRLQRKAAPAVTGCSERVGLGVLDTLPMSNRIFREKATSFAPSFPRQKSPGPYDS